MNQLTVSQLAVLRDRVVATGGSWAFADEIEYIAAQLCAGQCLMTYNTQLAAIHQFLPRQPVEGFQPVTVNQG